MAVLRRATPVSNYFRLLNEIHKKQKTQQVESNLRLSHFPGELRGAVAVASQPFLPRDRCRDIFRRIFIIKSVSVDIKTRFSSRGKFSLFASILLFLFSFVTHGITLILPGLSYSDRNEKGIHMTVKRIEIDKASVQVKAP